MKNNWPVKKLGEVLAEISDGNYSSKYPKSQDFVNQGIPFIRAVNFKNGQLVWDDMRYIKPEKHAELKKGHVKTSDVLITTRGEIGTMAFVTSEFEDANINAQIVRLQADPIKIVPSFLFYLLNSQYAKSQFYRITTGSTLRQLSVQNLHLLKVRVPSLLIQKKIVERLDAIRKAQEFCDQQIKKTEELFESILHNEITKSGKETLLTEVTDFQEGPGILAKDFRTSGIPLVRLKGTTGPEVTLTGCNFLDAAMVKKKWNHFILKKGDLLLTTSASLGQVSEVASAAEGAITYTGIIRFRPDKNALNKGYLKYFLSSELFKLQARSVATGGVIKHFGPIHLKKMKIFLPSLKKQEIIAKKLEKVQNYKKLLQKQKVLFKELLDSVLDKSMKGEMDF